jgi:uncharacterized membrane protein
MRIGFIAALASLLISCGSEKSASEPPAVKPAEAAPPAPSFSFPIAGGAEPGVERWDLQQNGQGSALVLSSGAGEVKMRLSCGSGEDRFLVNVPAFRPVGSEERLSFGSGGHAVALVADTKGDAERGGVSGTGSVPGDLAQLTGGQPSASYGSQKSGPHPAVPRGLSDAFVKACAGGGGKAVQNAQPAAPTANPCLVQEGVPLQVAPRRAVGTEPFWSAGIVGRCVTYAHPEDQSGTRIWTRYAKGPDGETWSGALGGQAFELRIRSRPGCSDGMSDRSYPLSAELNVRGEKRSGCAAPA